MYIPIVPTGQRLSSTHFFAHRRGEPSCARCRTAGAAPPTEKCSAFNFPRKTHPSNRGRLPPHPRRQGRQQRLHAALVVVRVAGCRRDLGDAVRALFGDLPSRPTSCMIPRNWTGAMSAMRRRARRCASFARTDTAVPREHGGGWPMLKRQGIGSCTLCARYASRRHGSGTRRVLVSN